ncbi:unnamed protein product [Microthlaspi erraticum]|uniref:CTLH domain-containing protein n=1 Tax=Microthlaspi erraticum TaxID=1685480 RepID=A0A6D2I1Q0_9BRAS|nr:unnamed protein product [Microthlaspi erraticum]
MEFPQIISEPSSPADFLQSIESRSTSEESFAADYVEEQLSENERDLDTSKRLVKGEEWNFYAKDVKIRKEDLNRLVMDFLVAEGYPVAVEKFQEETGTQRILFLVDFCYFLNKKTAEIDLASIADRSAVIRAIECGNMDVATEKLSALNPEILETNFYFKQQKTIELIREGKGEEATAYCKKELTPLVQGNKALLEELERTITLRVFDDPYPCQYKELIDTSRRFKSASEVNAAILTNQTGEKGSKLERLLKMLFWTQDQADEKALYPRLSDLSTCQSLYPWE